MVLTRFKPMLLKKMCLRVQSDIFFFIFFKTTVHYVKDDSCDNIETKMSNRFCIECQTRRPKIRNTQRQTSNKSTQHKLNLGLSDFRFGRNVLFSTALDVKREKKKSEKRALIVCTYHYNIGVGSFCVEFCCNRYVSIVMLMSALLVSL